MRSCCSATRDSERAFTAARTRSAASSFTTIRGPDRAAGARRTDAATEFARENIDAVTRNRYDTSMTLHHHLAVALPALMSELLHGSPDARKNTYMLNRGDEGLLRSLERLSADQASASSHGGATIAGHVDHLRYGMSLLNTWGANENAPWDTADWTAAWRTTAVDDAQWKSLLGEFRREADAWLETLRKPHDYTEDEIKWFLGNTAHLAYHMGAIRQIGRAARGPTAEDEVRVKRKGGLEPR